MANHFKNKLMSLKSKLLLFGIMLTLLGTNPLAAQQINGGKTTEIFLFVFPITFTGKPL
jgi:hypothetical protein